MIAAGTIGKVRVVPAPTPATRRPSGLALTTSGPWTRLDLEPTTRSAALADLVRDRLGDHPDTLAQRRQIAAALRSSVREITATGTVYAAVLIEVIGATVVQATFLASYADLPSGTHDPGERVRQALGADRLDTLDLPVGRSYRLSTHTEIAGPGGESAPALIVQYAAAVPGSEQALVLSFSSPNVEHRDTLTGLFDALARAARWRYPASS